MVVLVIPLGWLSDSTRRRTEQGVLAVVMSSVFGLIGVIAPCGVHLFLIFLHGTSGQPFLSANVEGVTSRVRTFRASPRLNPGAGDPNDMGLSEHELRTDPP